MTDKNAQTRKYNIHLKILKNVQECEYNCDRVVVCLLRFHISLLPVHGAKHPSCIYVSIVK